MYLFPLEKKQTENKIDRNETFALQRKALLMPPIFIIVFNGHCASSSSEQRLQVFITNTRKVVIF